MKRLVAAVWVLFLAASVSHAGVVSLVDGTLNDLLGTGFSAIGSADVSDMKNNSVVFGEVTNQAYVNSGGDLWAYLYQVENLGSTAVEMFTLWPFAGADDATQIGCLTDLTGVDTDFVTGDQTPEDDGYISNGTSGPVISFYYSKRYGYEIATGEKSDVMYVLSDLPPGTVNGNIISGTVGTGLVVGAVPEPATAIYLILGGLSLLGFYRRR